MKHDDRLTLLNEWFKLECSKGRRREDEMPRMPQWQHHGNAAHDLYLQPRNHVL